MSGYLDNYGAGDEKREKAFRLLVRWGSAVLIVAALLFIVFHYIIPNRGEQATVKQFFDLLAAKNYKQAYAMWGCTDEKPCRDFPMSSFMQDWGPAALPITTVAVLDGESCGTGVIVDVAIAGAENRKLWVDRDGLVGSRPPGMDRCPQGNRIYDFFRDLRYRMHGRTYR